jgi:hypothetical protein
MLYVSYGGHTMAGLWIGQPFYHKLGFQIE